LITLQKKLHLKKNSNKELIINHSGKVRLRAAAAQKRLIRTITIPRGSWGFSRWIKIQFI
jgi:hypothetical protein